MVTTCSVSVAPSRMATASAGGHRLEVLRERVQELRGSLRGAGQDAVDVGAQPEHAARQEGGLDEGHVRVRRPGPARGRRGPRPARPGRRARPPPSPPGWRCPRSTRRSRSETDERFTAPDVAAEGQARVGRGEIHVQARLASGGTAEPRAAASGGRAVAACLVRPRERPQGRRRRCSTEPSEGGVPKVRWRSTSRRSKPSFSGHSAAPAEQSPQQVRRRRCWRP